MWNPRYERLVRIHWDTSTCDFKMGVACFSENYTMMLCHAPLNIQMRVSRRRYLNAARKWDDHKRYIVPLSVHLFPKSNITSFWIYKCVSEFQMQPSGNFGTNLTNLFIRLYHNYPFHSLPQRHNLHPNSTIEFTSSDPSRRTASHEAVTSQSTILPLCVTNRVSGI
jgi:hypothetical protein